MQQDTLTRRIELLRMEGLGLSPHEIVVELSKKFNCAERTVYLDFEERDVWQPKLTQMKTALLRILNRHEEAYRKAVFQYTSAQDVRDRLAALSLMRTINVDAFNFIMHTGSGSEVFERLKEKLQTGAELDELLKEYDESIQRARARDIQAYSASEQVDSAQADSETS